MKNVLAISVTFALCLSIILLKWFFVKFWGIQDFNIIDLENT